jgi:hypothetical protein
LSAAWKNGELLLDSLDSSDGGQNGGQSGSQGGSEGGNQNQRRLSSALTEYDGSCGMSSWESVTETLTGGATLPCNCDRHGHAFIGIPMASRFELTRTDWSMGGETASFQSCYDFQELGDYDHDYHSGMGTNHGWWMGHGGEETYNPSAYMRLPDHITIDLFGLGYMDSNYGGINLDDVYNVMKK